jgi:hypothetical protein
MFAQKTDIQVLIESLAIPKRDHQAITQYISEHGLDSINDRTIGIVRGSVSKSTYAKLNTQKAPKNYILPRRLRRNE